MPTGLFASRHCLFRRFVTDYTLQAVLIVAVVAEAILKSGLLTTL